LRKAVLFDQPSDGTAIFFGIGKKNFFEHCITMSDIGSGIS